MAKSIKVKPKKRGRPATGKNPFVGVRLPSPLIANIDKWAEKNGGVTRSAAIRRLVENGLALAKPAQKRGTKTTAKASHLASQEIDRLEDQTATQQERDRRKRRLLKGPEEFRDIRSDRPKR